jgi:hypothetical protein
MRHPILFSLVLALTISGCGGGGGGGGGGNSGGNDSPADNQPPVVTPAQNQLQITVEAGPASMVNVPFVSVTVCSPGTNNCKMINHLIVDTGSSGLRIVSSALAPLTLQSVSTGNSESLAECVQFISGHTWGAIRSADIKLGEHTLSDLAIQVIGDTTAGNAPASCANTGPAMDTVKSIGGNGILGVGVFSQDCGSRCAGSAIPGTYYACSGASCEPVSVPLDRQVHNPVALLSSDNNGVVMELPAVPSSGAASASGTLTLGIGTQANNSLENAMVIRLDANGNFVTNFNGANYTGFLDSGSNGLFFASTIPKCSSNDFYCPLTVQNLTATNSGTDGATSDVSFQVENARTLFNTGNVAFNNLAAPMAGYFDWGLPFFFGRKVFTAIEGKSTPGGTGPYVAY